MNFQVTIMFGLGFEFCGGHFKFCWVIFVITDLLNFFLCFFLAAILNSNFNFLTLEFGLQTSNFRNQKSPLSSCTFI